MNCTAKFKYAVLLSLIIVVAGIVVGAIFGGFNMGVDFAGGTQMNVEMNSEFSAGDVEAVLGANGAVDVTVLKSGPIAGAQTRAIIRFKADGNEAAAQESIMQGLKAKYPNSELLDTAAIGATAGVTLIENALLALLVAGVAVFVYVWMRFKVSTGLAALVILLHDILITVAFASIVRVPINTSFIAAVFVVFGYSLDSSVSIFDRVRINARPHGNAIGPHRAEVVNHSIAQSRLHVVCVSLAALVIAALLCIFGGASIREFALPVIVGVIAGAYSSLFVAGPFWIYLHKASDEKRTKKHRGTNKKKGRKAGK